MEIELTDDEKKAIASLKRVAKKWPESLWLFSASGSLCVMKYDDNGIPYETKSGCMDPDAIVDSIDIPNDGGDW